MAKVVKRTYYSKRLDKYVTKTYTYSSNAYKYKRGARKTERLFTVSKGKYNLKEQAWNNFVNKTLNDESLSQAEYITLKNQLEMTKRRILAGNENYKTASGRLRKIDESSILSRLAQDKISRYLINMGWSVEEIAQDLNVSEDDLLNPVNWNKGIFTAKDGRQWSFTFDYRGRPYKRTL